MQHVLGHSNPQTTLKFYSQVDPQHIEQVKRTIEGRRSSTKKSHQVQTHLEKNTYEVRMGRILRVMKGDNK